MRSHAFSFLLILISMISIQLGASFAKEAFQFGNPSLITVLRLYSATLLLMLIWRPWKKKFDKTWRVPLFFYGISLGLMNLCFYWSLQRIPLGLAVALEFLGPLSVALFKSRRSVDYIWLALAATGLVLIFPLHQLAVKVDLLGVLLALMAGGFWAAYIVFGRWVSQSENLGGTMAYGMLIAALAVTPICFFWYDTFVLSGSLMIAGIAIGILSSALPYTLEMMALKNISTQLFGLLMSLEPAIATLMGWLNLNEKLAPIQLIAIFLIVVASIGGTFTLHMGSGVEAVK